MRNTTTTSVETQCCTAGFATLQKRTNVIVYIDVCVPHVNYVKDIAGPSKQLAYFRKLSWQTYTQSTQVLRTSVPGH